MPLPTAQRGIDSMGGSQVASSRSLAATVIAGLRRLREAIGWIGAFRYALGTLSLVVVGAASAQSDVRPLTLVVPFPPGGSTDFVVRALQPKLAERIGRPVIVDNRPGAASQLATQHVARAAPDGNTLLVAIDNHALNPIIKPRLPYDTFADFVAVGQLVRFPFVIWAHPSVPGSDLRQFIEQARREAPGRYSFATTGVGSLNHLAPEHLQRLAGIEWLHVPFAGGGAVVNAVAANTVHLGFLSLALMRPQLQAGRVKPLAVTGATRMGDLPQVPTVAESGFPGFEVHSWTGLFAPVGTPEPIVQKLAADVQAVLADPAVHARLTAAGFEVKALGPAAFELHVRAEHDRWMRFVRESGLKIVP